MSMTWEDYQVQVLYDAKDYLEMELSSLYYQYNRDFETMFVEELSIDEIITGIRCNEYMGDHSDPADNVGAVFFSPTVQNWFADYGYDQFWMPMKAAEIDSMVRYFALESQYSELEEYYEQLLDEQGEELAISIVMEHSNLSHDNAKRALECLSEATDGTWLDLACDYGCHLREVVSSPEKWLESYPNDTILDIVDNGSKTLILSEQYMGHC